MICGCLLARIIEEDHAEPSRALGHLCELARDSRLRPRYEVLAFEQAAEAHRRIEARELTGKLVLAAAFGDAEA
jgi:NADPH:quinone reductase-like Zn-dependent oxidoreductase